MKRHRHRIVFALLPILLLSFGISACVHVEAESEFESDGSGRHSVTLTLERTLIDESALGIDIDQELDFDAIQRQAEAVGIEVERIDTADRLGITVSKEVEDNEDLAQVLADLFSALIGTQGVIDGFQGGFMQVDSGVGGTTYQFELTVDGSQMLPFDQSELDEELSDEPGMDFNLSTIRQVVNLTYTVGMPGEVTDHNGTAQGPRRVQWDVPLEGSETFFAESEEGSSLSIAMIAGIIIGIIALVLIILGGVSLMRGQRIPPGVPPAASGDTDRRT